MHSSILSAVVGHSAFTALVVLVDNYVRPIGLPGSIIPSLSIVVGLILVFRNGTSYDRFWTGRNNLQGLISGVRCLARCFLVNCRSMSTEEATEDEYDEVENTVRLLIAILYEIGRAHVI